MTKTISWFNLRKLINARGLSFSWTQDADTYIVTAIDDVELVELICTIPRTIPILADQRDFETNYKSVGLTPESESLEPPATAVKQDLMNAILTAISSGTPRQLGTSTVKQSSPIVLASDHPPLPLPAGAASDALQQAIIKLLTSLDGKMSPLASGRMPVDINDQPYAILINDVPLKASGSMQVPSLGPNSLMTMIVRIKGPVTGSTPTLTLTLQDIDPATGLVTGNQIASTVYSSTTTPQTFSFVTRTGKVQLIWTVTGTTPVFNHVFVTVSALAFGGKQALTPSSATFTTVGVASASAVAQNLNRKGLVLVNTSNANISLGIGVAAVLNSGITLYPGGVWEMDEYTFTTAQIFAIASAAASNLGIQEFIS